MSVLQKPKARNRKTTWNRVWDRLLGSEHRKPQGRKPRHLTIDSLEARTLLSVSPSGVADMQINQTPIVPVPILAGAPGHQYITTATPALSGKSVATDNNGDFVAVWSSYDANAASGSGGAVADVYARYFTQAVQLIDLPSSLTPGSKFELRFTGFDANENPYLGVTAPITVSSNPATTAANIAYAFNTGTLFYVNTAPIFFPPDASITPTGTSYAAYNSPVVLPDATTVTVTANSATEFVVTFTGDNGYMERPAMSVVNTSNSPIAGAAVTIIKQSSDEFRVNDPEPQDPQSDVPSQYNQYDAQVAMDSSGGFVITWQGDVPNATNSGTVSEIFARRFSPTGYTYGTVPFQADMGNNGNPATYTPIQSVLPLGDQFLVNTPNTVTANNQSMPSIGMDDNGDFTIAWQTQGQTLSYFNEIDAQRYDLYGNALGSQFQVNATDPATSVNFQTYVAMSPDGKATAIGWTNTTDPNYFVGNAYLAAVSATVYDNQGNQLWGEFKPGAYFAGGTAMAFDTGDNLVITGDSIQSTDDIGNAGPNTEVFGIEYQLFNPTTGALNPAGTVLRTTFRANSANFNPAAATFWPGTHELAQPAMDADGDLTIAYDGFGPDVAEGVTSPVLTANTVAPSGIVDISHYTGNQNVGLLEGDPNAAMFSQFDAYPGAGVQNIVSSDNIANNTRDGQNTIYDIAIQTAAVSGNFTVSITDPGTTTALNVTITPAYLPNNGPLDVAGTTGAIHNAIQGAVNRVATGNWPQPPSPGASQYQGTVMVTQIPTPAGGNSALTYYEVDFIGELHDSLVTVTTGTGTWNNVKLPAPPGGGTAPTAEVDILSAQTYSAGTAQYASSIAMTSSGSFVMMWNQADSGNNLFFRGFTESTDTAGPSVTDFLLPTPTGAPAQTTGQPLNNGATITTPINQIVVTFDKNMLNSGPTGVNSVTNPNNWALLENGSQVTGGIVSISFGMNEAHLLNPSAPANNQYEAVITLSPSGNSENGLSYLPDGQYQIVATTKLCDVNGEPLGVTGYTPNGVAFSRSFAVALPTGSETLVNANPAGNQITAPPNSQATASDANGDYAVAWASDTTGAAGLYTKLYAADWSTNSSGQRVSNPTIETPINPATGSPWANNEILVTAASGSRVSNGITYTFTNVSNASVGMDSVGDFVVTWSEQDTWAGQTTADWNVWAERYDATGKAEGAAFMVNTTTANVQRYSVVAMDAQGDFTIAWQSLGQDGSGYGIYAQRYESGDGAAIGGTDELDILDFTGVKTNTQFTLSWNGQTTAPITYPSAATGNMVGSTTVTFAQDVQNKLTAINANVTVVALNGTQLAIQFTGVDGSQNVAPITVAAAAGTPSTAVLPTESTRLQGASGEFLVNDTTAGDQMFPAIAMDPSGAFVISWTSYVTGSGTTGLQSNIYAKQFVSNDVIRATTTSIVQEVAQASDSTATSIPGAKVTPMVVTTDNPANHVVLGGTPGMTGVVELVVTRTDLPAGEVDIGSGSLLLDDLHILTAAHVVCDNLGNMVATNIQVYFNVLDAQGNYVMIPALVTNVAVNPQYKGVPWVSGGDLAVLTLSAPAPAGVQGYGIYSQPNALGQVFTMVGYGLSGTGTTGDTIPTGAVASTGVVDPERTGQNLWEGNGSLIGYNPDSLVYDFDSGSAKNDVFGQLFGLNNLGLGANEAMSAPGDSGGPEFINGQIAGVTSYGVSIPGPWNIATGNPLPDSSFGEIGADVNVSLYAGWINTVTAATGTEILVNTTTGNTQKWSSVAMDTAGDFVVAWTSSGQNGGATGNDVFARRFNANGTPVAAQFQVNTFTQNNQQYPKVAMDAAGDFTIVWESYQDRSGGSSVPNSYGIYGQRYVRTSLIGTSPDYGPNGEVYTEFQANTTQAGAQRYPSIAMDDTGDFLIVWSGNGTQSGQVDSQGVFMQRLDQPADTAGPRVVETFDVVTGSSGTTFTPVFENQVLTTDVSSFMVDFTENLNTGNGPDPGQTGLGANSVTNPANWILTQNGTIITNGVSSVTFGLDPATNRYEAVVTFDGNPTTAGNQALTDGTYVLTATDNIQDAFGNALDGALTGLPGSGNFSRTFIINTGTGGGGGGGGSGGGGGGGGGGSGGGGGGGTGTVPLPGTPPAGGTDNLVSSSLMGTQNDPAVASDPLGDFVAAWIAGNGDVLAQLFNASGAAVGGQFVVNSTTVASDEPPAVAMDGQGNFIVVWAGSGAADSAGVYAQAYDNKGATIGGEFLVNQTTANTQDMPSVAMDAAGDWVATWTSAGQVNGQSGIFGRHGNLQGASGNEFLVNSNLTDAKANSSVAMDPNGDFTVVWQSYGQDGSSWGVFGKQFSASGTAGAEFEVNKYTNDKQIDPKVAMDANGDFVVTWASFGQDGSGYGVYARRFNAAGAALDANDVQINQTTLNWQITPDVGMDSKGDYVITWSSFGQIAASQEYDIYARIFYANGSDYVLPNSSQPLGEFRINVTTLGNHVTPAITVNPSGEYAIFWVGPAGSTTGIYDSFANPWPAPTPPTTTTMLVVDSMYAGDFNDNGTSDILWWNQSTGVVGAWMMQNGASTGWVTFGTASPTVWRLAGVGDFTGDGTSDVLWQNLTTGDVGAWIIKNGATTGWAGLGNASATTWKVAGIGDFNGNGTDDVLWQNLSTGQVGAWIMSNGASTAWAGLGNASPATWQVAGIGDFNGNGTDDVLWQNQVTGDVGAWIIKNAASTGWASLGNAPITTWKVLGVGDINGNGTSDVLWQNLSTGSVGAWMIKNAASTGWASLGTADPTVWVAPAVGDFTGNGTDDVLWQNESTGAVDAWIMKNAASTGWTALGNAPTSTWQVGGATYTVETVANLQAASVVADPASDVATLTQSELQPIVQAAIARWANVGMDAATLDKLESVQFVIGDLPGADLGQAVETADRIYISPNAAGNGWFIDPTPATDEEFAATGNGAQLQAIDPQAVDRIDLLTVVEHELGHIAGLDDLSAAVTDVMDGVLGTGIRRDPTVADIDRLFAST